MAYVVMAYIVMAYLVMVYVVMAYVVMAYIVMAYIVMAYYSYGRSDRIVNPLGRHDLPVYEPQHPSEREPRARRLRQLFGAHLYRHGPGLVAAQIVMAVYLVMAILRGFSALTIRAH